MPNTAAPARSPHADSQSRRRSGGRRNDAPMRVAPPPSRERRRRRRTTRRHILEAPLPEDVAFRPAERGGDPTLLPRHYGPPPGLRTTARVWLVAPRNLPRFAAA